MGQQLSLPLGMNQCVSPLVIFGNSTYSSNWNDNNFVKKEELTYLFSSSVNSIIDTEGIDCK